jgi:hypothetical protein
MVRFQLFASPWWVNLLILIPAVVYLLSRNEKIRIGKQRLLIAALFGIAFGFVEAAVVVYLRFATGLWPGPPEKMLMPFPVSLLKIECVREAATMIMLGSVAWFVAQRIKARFVAFLWTFAFWDFFYYIWLRVTIGWPGSLLTPDLLFLIPVPWLAQVWFPLLVSGLTAVVIWFRS